MMAPGARGRARFELLREVYCGLCLGCKFPSKYPRSCVRLVRLQPEAPAAGSGGGAAGGRRSDKGAAVEAQRQLLRVMHSTHSLEMQLSDPQGGQKVHPFFSGPAPFRWAAGRGRLGPRALLGMGLRCSARVSCMVDITRAQDEKHAVTVCCTLLLPGAPGCSYRCVQHHPPVH